MKCLTWSMNFLFLYLWRKWRDSWKEYMHISFHRYIIFTIVFNCFQNDISTNEGLSDIKLEKIKVTPFQRGRWSIKIAKNTLQCFGVYEDQVLNFSFDFIYQENLIMKNVFSINHITGSFNLPYSKLKYNQSLEIAEHYRSQRSNPSWGL